MKTAIIAFAWIFGIVAAVGASIHAGINPDLAIFGIPILAGILAGVSKPAWKWMRKCIFILSGATAVLGLIVLTISALDGWHFVAICAIFGSIMWLIQSMISDGVEQGIRNSQN